MSEPTDRSHRDAEIVRARNAGKSFRDIGRAHGLSAGRVKQIFDRQERFEHFRSEIAGTPREVLSTRAYNIVAQILGLGVGWTREQLQAAGLDALEDHRTVCGSRALRELEEYLSGVEHGAERAEEFPVGMRP